MTDRRQLALLYAVLLLLAVAGGLWLQARPRQEPDRMLRTWPFGQRPAEVRLERGR